ncbi:MAG TPA: LytTR family DNA-binding domain-containing protein [Acidobacteriaceae bacterium]
MCRDTLSQQTVSAWRDVDQSRNPRKFIRIHRSRVVNLSRIASIRPLFNGTYEVELSDGSRLATGKSYREQIAQLLRNSS